MGTKDGRVSFQIIYFLVYIFLALLIFDSLRENGDRKKTADENRVLLLTHFLNKLNLCL